MVNSIRSAKNKIILTNKLKDCKKYLAEEVKNISLKRPNLAKDKFNKNMNFCLKIHIIETEKHLNNIFSFIYYLKCLSIFFFL
jgi:hypothetical protein